MSPIVREHFKLELSLARLAEKSSDFKIAWKHLARAHILGQIPRLLLAAPGSWTKRAPIGNTGLSDVAIFQPLEVPDDLKQILQQ